jgi:hypothetical protein
MGRSQPHDSFVSLRVHEKLKQATACRTIARMQGALDAANARLRAFQDDIMSERRKLLNEGLQA